MPENLSSSAAVGATVTIEPIGEYNRIDSVGDIKEGNIIEIDNPFKGASVNTSEPIEFWIHSVRNPNSAKEAGKYTISTFLKIDDE